MSALTRRLGDSDDTGSIAMAMMLTLVGAMLSALLMPMVISQVGATRAEVERVRALHAAQAGLDVAVGHIRAANDGEGVGVLSKLPCGPLSGEVGEGGKARYQVSIDYLAVDPVGESDTWVAERRIPCIAGGGTVTAPVYAMLTSVGTDGVARRSLRGDYTFKTTNENIKGGPIHAFSDSAVDLCMDAGTTSPAAGTNLRMQPCVPGSNTQKFAYNKNLTIVLVSSKTPTTLGMCLDAGSPHNKDDVVQFQPCGAVTQPQQQWSYNNMQNLEGTSDGQNLDGYCFNVKEPDRPGSFVVLGKGGGDCGGSDNSTKTFWPEASVGAGAAGADTHQVVNFEQFGRCIDVTEMKNWEREGYLIVWPCKQKPDATKISWNQKWTLPEIEEGEFSGTGRIITNPTDDPALCLKSYGLDGYVLLGECPGGATPGDMEWTVYRYTGVYATSYQIVNNGLCLSTTDQGAVPGDFHRKGQKTTKLIMEACDGSVRQKWNADPDTLASLVLKDIREQ
jgi:hypothetical protein